MWWAIWRRMWCRHVGDGTVGGERFQRCPLADVLKSRMTLARAKITKQFQELSSPAIHCFARSPTVERLFESKPRTLPVEHFIVENRRTLFATCRRVARVGLLSVVGRCPWSGYGAAGWSGRLVWVSRRLSPERRGRRSPAKAPRFCRGTESGTLVNGAEKAHKSGGEPDARDPSCGVISGHIGARCPPTPPYPKGGV
jgi:hypothetical protein